MVAGCRAAPTEIPLLRFLRLARLKVGMSFREFRAEKEYLRRIIDPKQDHDQRAGRAVRRRYRGASDIPTNQRLARYEQKSRDGRTQCNFTPGDRTVGQNFVDC